MDVAQLLEKSGFVQKLCAAVGITLLAAACATEPATQFDAAGNAVAATSNPQDEMECRTMKSTGTNMPRRVCRSKRVWDAISGNERETADEFGRQTRENSAIVPTGASNQPLGPVGP